MNVCYWRRNINIYKIRQYDRIRCERQNMCPLCLLFYLLVCICTTQRYCASFVRFIFSFFHFLSLFSYTLHTFERMPLIDLLKKKIVCVYYCCCYWHSVFEWVAKISSTVKLDEQNLSSMSLQVYILHRNCRSIFKYAYTVHRHSDFCHWQKHTLHLRTLE